MASEARDRLRKEEQHELRQGPFKAWPGRGSVRIFGDTQDWYRNDPTLKKARGIHRRDHLLSAAAPLCTLLCASPHLSQAFYEFHRSRPEKKRYGKLRMGVVRSTFVIGENGVIEKVMSKVKPDANAAEILSYLKGDE